MVLFQQMLVFFIVMFTGTFASRHHYLDGNASDVLSRLVVDFANPTLLLACGFEAEQVKNVPEYFTCFGAATAVYIGLFLVGFGTVAVIRRLPDGSTSAARLKWRAPIFHAMFLFSNIGFMALPLVRVLYGPAGVVYVNMYSILWDIFYYAVGNRIVGANAHLTARDVLNPGFICSIVCVPLFIFAPKVPAVVTSVLDMIGNLATPLSLMVIGASLARIPVRGLRVHAESLLFMAIKLLVIPLVFVSLLRLIVTNTMFLQVTVVVLATPVGSMAAMLAAKKSEEAARYASLCVAVTTVAAVITMPLIAAVLDI